MPSKASQEKHRERYREWQQRRYPNAGAEERRAIHDADKAAAVPWRERRERYSALRMEPLRVTLRTHVPIVHYSAPYLEGLLAWAVVMEETGGEGVEKPPRYTPLPLEVAGFYGSGGQLPLWKAGAIMPAGFALRDVVWVHKRAPAARHSQTKAINTSTGRYMERRIPLPTLSTPEWESLCYGNALEIARLLDLVAFVGKRRGVGFGEVASWEIAPWEGGDPHVSDGRLMHAIPQEHAARAGYGIVDAPVLVGWTPPHWSPALWALGWPEGTAVTGEADWYAAADHFGSGI